MKLKIVKIDNSAGVLLSDDLLAHLGVQVGDTLSVVATPRGVELCRLPAEVAEQLAAAQEVMLRRQIALADKLMDDDHKILSELAKR